jgi:hypothetical protein
VDHGKACVRRSVDLLYGQFFEAIIVFPEVRAQATSLGRLQFG